MKPTYYSRFTRNEIGMNVIDERTRYRDEGDESPMTDYDQLDGKPVDFFMVTGVCANPDCKHNQGTWETEVPVNILGLCGDCAAAWRAETLDLPEEPLFDPEDPEWQPEEESWNPLAAEPRSRRQAEEAAYGDDDEEDENEE